MGDVSYFSTTPDEADATRRAAEAEAQRLAEATIARDQRTSEEEVRLAAAGRGSRGDNQPQEAADRDTGAAPKRSDFERRVLAATALEAPLSEGQPLNVEELKSIGAAMRQQGKLFLSNDEIDETAAALRDTKTPEARTTLKTESGVVVQDASGQPISTGEHPLREGAEGMASLGLAAAVTRTMIGKGTELEHLADELHGRSQEMDRRYTAYRSMSEMEIFNRSTTEGTDDSAKEELRKRAIDATMNLSDKGDMIAASRLMDRIEHNATTQEIAAALMELENAKRAEDVTIHLRNGKTISIVNDGDASPEVTVTGGDEQSQDYSISSADPGSSMSASSPRLGRRLIRALAGAATFSEAVAEAKRNDPMHLLKEKPADNSNPLGLKFPLDVPPLEMLSGGMDVKNPSNLQVALGTPPSPKGHSQGHSLPSFQ